MVGFVGRFGHGVSMLTTIGVTSVILDAQRSNVVNHRLKRLCVSIVVMLINKVDTLEPAQIVECLFHRESEPAFHTRLTIVPTVH